MPANHRTDNNLQHLTTQLTQLRRGGVAEGKAIHKPVLILALMEVLENNKDVSPAYLPIDAVLYQQFQETWRILSPGTGVGDFFQPVLYLPNEGFWQVFTRTDQQPVKKYGSLKGAATDGLWSCFHPDYKALLALPEVREIVRMVLLDTYFPDTKQAYHDVHGQAALIIQQEALLRLEEPSPRYIRQVQFGQLEGFVRHWKFRINVLYVYDHTCCISGLWTRKGLSHPLLDACHIQDHAFSGINHPDNGLALCKNLHAAFDAGLISLTDDYRVLVSKSFQESDTLYSLHRLTGQEIRLPVQLDYRPKVSYIRLHRARWGF